jgi:Lrp/AsnC family transcriptional regulator
VQETSLPGFTRGKDVQDKLDNIDLRILELLQADAGLSASEIADRVGLSPSPCWRRIRRLEEIGIVRGRVALLDRRRLGLKVMVMAQVRFAGRGRQALEEFEAAIAGFPEVVECFMLMGENDFILKVVTRDVEGYEHFLRHRLSRLPVVQSVNSSMVMGEVKNTTVLPLQFVRDEPEALR